MECQNPSSGTIEDPSHSASVGHSMHGALGSKLKVFLGHFSHRNAFTRPPWFSFSPLVQFRTLIFMVCSLAIKGDVNVSLREYSDGRALTTINSNLASPCFTCQNAHTLIRDGLFVHSHLFLPLISPDHLVAMCRKITLCVQTG